MAATVVEALTSEDAADPAASSLADPATVDGRVRPPWRERFVDELSRFGVFAALCIVVGILGVLSPDSFFTVASLQAMLANGAPLLLVAAGVTVVLAVGEFDLSFASMSALASAISIVLITGHSWGWGAAVVAALGVALVVGVVNGLLVAYLGAPSFITTLAMGTVLTGNEFLLTDQKTIIAPLPGDFRSLGISTPLFGLNTQFYIAFGVVLFLWLLLDATELGRYMYAVGGNREASKLSGVRVSFVVLIGFVVVALCAAVVGILLSAQGSAYTPGTGSSYLLPAYAAAFLGAATFRPGKFNLPGTLVGVALLEVIETGLIMLQLSTAIVDLVQGAILIAAMVLSRLGKR